MLLVITIIWLGVFYSSVIVCWNLVCWPLITSGISDIFKVLETILTTHTSTVHGLRLALSNNTLRIVWLCILISVAVFTLMINGLTTCCVRLIIHSRISHLIICLLICYFVVRLLRLISDVATYRVLVIVNYIRWIVRNNFKNEINKINHI